LTHGWQTCSFFRHLQLQVQFSQLFGALTKPDLFLCFRAPHERFVAGALDSSVEFAQISAVFDALAQVSEFAATLPE